MRSAVSHFCDWLMDQGLLIPPAFDTFTVPKILVSGGSKQTSYPPDNPYFHAFFLLLPLPAGFFYAGNLPFIRQFTEANPAEAELAQDGVRPSAPLTPVVGSHFEFRFALGFGDHRFFGQWIPLLCCLGNVTFYCLRKGMPCWRW
jgi:hypothetical protein